MCEYVLIWQVMNVPLFIICCLKYYDFTIYKFDLGINTFKVKYLAGKNDVEFNTCQQDYI